MGNLCAIFHQRFKPLIHLVPNIRQAQLLDYILLGWQTSTYRLKNSDKVWFMKPYATIMEDTGIPRSSLERYIRNLVDLDFLERRQALYARTDEETGFSVKKGTYLSVTDKLLSLLKASQETINAEKPVEAPTNPSKQSLPTPTTIPNPSEQGTSHCSEIVSNEGTDSLKMRESYIRDLYTIPKNNIIAKRLASVDKDTQQQLLHQFQSIQTYLEKTVKEEVPLEVKRTVLGIFFNLTFEHKKVFSCPPQVIAEYLYALRNVDFHLSNVRCFKHRNNVLAKLIRTNQWRTPKGFYQHDYLGEGFKHMQNAREENWRAKKVKELTSEIPAWLSQTTQLQLSAIEKQMLIMDDTIKAITQQIYDYEDEHDIAQAREKIETLREERRLLSNQHWALQEEPEDDCAGWS